MRWTAALALHALAIPAAAAPGAARDPAVVGGEARVRHSLPTTSIYQAETASVRQSTVVLVFLEGDLAGFTRREKARCAFAFNRAKAQWTFDSNASAEERGCQRISERAAGAILKGDADAARTLQPRLVRCLPLLEAVSGRKFRQEAVEASLIQRGLYPIAAGRTALRPKP
jgi:hypothetical protein